MCDAPVVPRGVLRGIRDAEDGVTVSSSELGGILAGDSDE